MIRGISLPRAESAASGALLPADRRRAWSSAGREIWPLGQRWDDAGVKEKKKGGTASMDPDVGHNIRGTRAPWLVWAGIRGIQPMHRRGGEG